METIQLEQLQQEHDRLFGSARLPRRRVKQDDNNKTNRNDEDEEEKDQKPTVDVGEEVEEEDAAVPEPTNDEKEEEEEEPQSLVGETRIDLVKLVPFDVKISLIMTEEDPLNTFALTEIVTEWMDESLEAEVERMQLGLSHSLFDSAILEERGLTYHKAPVASDIEGAAETSTTSSKEAEEPSSPKDGNNRRKLEPTGTIASYEGVTLWKHPVDSNRQIMTPTLLEDIERQALLRDDRLLELLQASPAQGLGDQVQHVRAYINPSPTTYVPLQDPNATNNNNTVNANLELLIVVAIVVACMAFAFLVFSVFWAWRFDQQRRDATDRNDSSGNKASKTPAKRSNRSGPTEDSDEEEVSAPANIKVLIDPANDGLNSETNPTTGFYPDSVVSEDISTSLSAYYRSGMGTRPLYSNRTPGNNDFNDQASFSSMESYGYSLDGYAPSLGGNTYSNAPAVPLRSSASELGDDNTNKDP